MLKLSNRYKNTEKQTRLNDVIEQNSSQIINIFGYTLLAFALLDYLNLLFPPQLMNSNWEFQTIGGMVEMSWAILLGFILVFYRRQEDYVSSRELKFLSVISWLTLLAAIAYFIMAPLLVSNALRISSRNSASINSQLTAYSEQIEQIETKLNQTSDVELQQLLATFPNKEAVANLNVEEFRQQLLTENTSQQQAATKQLQQQLKQQQKGLYKSTFKWAIGAILTGASALLIWKSTRWARVLKMEVE